MQRPAGATAPGRCPILLTDVDAIYRDFGTDSAAAIRSLSVEEGRALDLPAGSMGPKLAAAADFADFGEFSGIGRLDDAVGMLQGCVGTRAEENTSELASLMSISYAVI